MRTVKVMNSPFIHENITILIWKSDDGYEGHQGFELLRMVAALKMPNKAIKIKFIYGLVHRAIFCGLHGCKVCHIIVNY
jgi:hypothetical protein